MFVCCACLHATLVALALPLAEFAALAELAALAPLALTKSDWRGKGSPGSRS